MTLLSFQDAGAFVRVHTALRFSLATYAAGLALFWLGRKISALTSLPHHPLASLALNILLYTVHIFTALSLFAGVEMGASIFGASLIFLAGYAPGDPVPTSLFGLAIIVAVVAALALVYLTGKLIDLLA